jgi:predicted nucleic acid-binding protein
VSVAYVDSSCLVAVAFDEPAAADVARRIEAYDQIVASNLLEAELRAALVREGVAAEPELLSGISWVFPDRSLSDELRRVLSHGYVRGADAWHIATALWVSRDPHDLPFLTLDGRQREVASSLGFPTP